MHRAHEVYEEGGLHALFSEIKEGEVHADGWAWCSTCNDCRPHEVYLCLVCETMVDKDDAP